jgi:hypothetical protein
VSSSSPAEAFQSILAEESPGVASTPVGASGGPITGMPVTASESTPVPMSVTVATVIE